MSDSSIMLVEFGMSHDSHLHVVSFVQMRCICVLAEVSWVSDHIACITRWV